MSRTKWENEYVDTSFGFEVHLFKVPMVQVRGVWTPKINYAELSQKVLKGLAEKNTRLTGNELRFIRLKLEMSLMEFAERFAVTHPAVLKWEQKGEQPTRMSWSTEKDIRLALCEHVAAIEFQQLYRALQKRPMTAGNDNTALKIVMQDEIPALV